MDGIITAETDIGKSDAKVYLGADSSLTNESRLVERPEMVATRSTEREKLAGMRSTTDPPTAWDRREQFRIIEATYELNEIALAMTETCDPSELDELYGLLEKKIAELLMNSPSREREFHKALLLLSQSLDGQISSDLAREQIRALAEVVNRLRTPRLSESDLADFRMVLLRSNLNPSRPVYHCDT